jgi:hypothetical protein
MNLANVVFINNALTLPETGDYTASALIAGFSYSAFTVSFDFNPTDFTNTHRESRTVETPSRVIPDGVTVQFDRW